MFEQKKRHGRADVKIYLCGLLLNGPDDPERNTFNDSDSFCLTEESLVCLAKHPSRLANEIRLYRFLEYSTIEYIAPLRKVNLLKRFTDLFHVIVDSSVQDTFELDFELDFLPVPASELPDCLQTSANLSKVRESTRKYPMLQRSPKPGIAGEHPLQKLESNVWIIQKFEFQMIPSTKIATCLPFLSVEAFHFTR